MLRANPVFTNLGQRLIALWTISAHYAVLPEADCASCVVSSLTIFIQRMAQLGQFAHATDERGVVFDEVVRRIAGTLGAVQPLADGGVELLERLPGVRLLQRLFARVVPRAQIEGLAALNLVNWCPAHELRGHLRPWILGSDEA